MARAPSKPVESYTRLRFHLLGRGPMYKIAAAAGIPPTLLSHYSFGWKTIPPGHLESLSEVLGVPADDLVGNMDPEQPLLEGLAQP